MMDNFNNILIWAYAATGFIGMLGYIPQIHKLVISKSNSQEVSISTWLVWVLTSFVSLMYIYTIVGDLLMSFIAVINLIGCITIVVLTCYNRFYRFPKEYIEI